MLKLQTTHKFRLLHASTHLLTAIGIGYVVMTGAYWWLLVSFAMFIYAGLVGINISLHRYFSHQGFKTGKFRHYFLLVSSFFPMVGSPAAWCSVHTYHHRWSDTDRDPHSPKNAGKFGAWFTLWPEMKIPLSYFKRFYKTKELKFIHRHYFKLILIYVALLALINPLLVIFVFAIPAFGCFHGASSVAVLPHIKNLPGNYRTHDTRDNSYNSVLTWIMSLGEGWHNNHHNRAGKYRHGEQWWEIDPAAVIIKYLFVKK